jgi:hypothetical protein
VVVCHVYTINSVLIIIIFADSGSIIFDEQGRAVAQINGGVVGNLHIAVCSPIGPVLQKARELVGGANLVFCACPGHN